MNVNLLQKPTNYSDLQKLGKKATATEQNDNAYNDIQSNIRLFLFIS